MNLEYIKHLKNALIFCPDSDKETINILIEKYQKEINLYNYSNIEVINPTKSELNYLHNSIKVLIKNQVEKQLKQISDNLYLNYEKYSCDIMWYLYENLQKQKTEIVLYFVNKTKFPKELIDSMILLRRKVKIGSLSPNSLEYQLNEIIKTKALDYFYKSNPNFEKEIIKIKEHYEKKTRANGTQELLQRSNAHHNSSCS